MKRLENIELLTEAFQLLIVQPWHCPFECNVDMVVWVLIIENLGIRTLSYEFQISVNSTGNLVKGNTVLYERLVQYLRFQWAQNFLVSCCRHYLPQTSYSVGLHHRRHRCLE